MGEPSLEELLRRMNDLHREEWTVTIHGGPDLDTEVIWDWCSDTTNYSNGDTPTYRTEHSHITDTPLSAALAIATAGWWPGNRVCPECEWDLLRHDPDCSLREPSPEGPSGGEQ